MIKKKIFFNNTFFPKHEENRMQNEGNVVESRKTFMNKRFNNLDYLLKSRYEWMKPYLKKDMKIVDIGCGAGLSKLYLSENILLTDIVENTWVDKVIDATDMNFEDESVDVIIAFHTIHHFYNPAKFFNECKRVLKKNGVILISDPNTSLMMRLILKLMRHEGFSYDVDVFDYKSICNDKSDPWSANCAIAELLFSNEKKFNDFFLGLNIEHQKKVEFTIFPFSGGVTTKIKMMELPNYILNVFNTLDKILIYLFPKIFPLTRNIVIRKF
jgi:2-polyprenyl-3-methyl-5-hydroxy-6-metoxy-1,4-benzoquinol methylase